MNFSTIHLKAGLFACIVQIGHDLKLGGIRVMLKQRTKLMLRLEGWCLYLKGNVEQGGFDKCRWELA